MTIKDADYVDDLVLLANTPGQSESQLQRLRQPAVVIGLYVNANKTEFIYSKEEEVTCTLSGRPLKLVDLLANIGSNISSIESVVNICLAYHMEI